MNHTCSERYEVRKVDSVRCVEGMVIVDVLLLGPVAVAGDNGVLSVGGEQQLRLLAAMASEVGRVVPLERLHAILWPEGQPTGATGALYSYVSRLRRALGRDVVVTSKVGYGLSPDRVVLDSATFERFIARARSLDPVGAIGVYDEALRLWRGPAYGAFSSEWWAQAAARRLEELRLVAMSERVSMLLALDRADEAAADTELLVELDPLRESFVQLRMVALHSDGRSAQAMQAALAFRRRLGEQSGLDPSPALSTLERRIADNDPQALTRPPRSLRGYVLEELIGEGATGAVYCAAQSSLDRRVAIKVVHRDRADEPAFVRRFETEARLVARLEHPCIVPLYDYWREPGAAHLGSGSCVAARFATSRQGAIHPGRFGFRRRTNRRSARRCAPGRCRPPRCVRRQRSVRRRPATLSHRFRNCRDRRYVGHHRWRRHRLRRSAARDLGAHRDPFRIGSGFAGIDPAARRDRRDRVDRRPDRAVAHDTTGPECRTVW